jgi:hypothetical protein
MQRRALKKSGKGANRTLLQKIVERDERTRMGS